MIVVNLVLYAFLQSAVAQNPDATPAVDSDFVSLFNGNDLDGWHIIQRPEGDKFHATKENFFAKDGVLHCFQLKNKHGGMLLTDKEYGQFDLVMDLKIDWGCDCGIMLHATKKGAAIQILNDYLENGSVGFPFGQQTGGFISQPIQLNKTEDGIKATDAYDGVAIDGLKYAIGADQWNKTWKPDGWNSIRIRCEGDDLKITTWINDVKIMELDGATYRGRSLKNYKSKNWDASSAWDSAKVEQITGNRGSIGFQLHQGRRWKPGGYARYRNIMIRELGDSP